MIKKNLTIESISINDYSFSPHKYARDAYDTNKLLKHQYTQKDYTGSLIETLQAAQPLHAKINNKNQIQFFSNWHWLALSYRNNVNNIAIVFHKNITNEFITESSWAYLISLNITTLHKSTNLAQLTQSLESTPLNLRKQILGEVHHSKSSKSTVRNLSNETIEAIKHQEKKMNAQQPSKKTILQLLE